MNLLANITAIVWIIGIQPFCHSCSIEEEADIGQVICNLPNLLSIEMKDNEVHQFNLMDHEHLFNLDRSTGILRVGARIDRENEKNCPAHTKSSPLQQECRLKLTVVHKMEGKSPRIHQVPLEIIDINDNPPVFEKNFQKIEIQEHFHPPTPFSLNRATDPDEGLNARITYKLQTDHKAIFSLENKSTVKDLKLRIARKFDREKEDSYKLLIIASDSGKIPKSATLTLQIVITNINDHKPEFPKLIYFQKVSENTRVNDVILTVRAEDKDVNDQVNYNIDNSATTDSKTTFSITQNGELLLIKPLDFERKKDYSIPIRASDSGQPPLSSTATITIKVLDENDNRPVIKIKSINANNRLAINENEEPNQLVGFITAKDQDEGDNGDVECSLGTNWDFRLDAYSMDTIKQYQLMTESRFDREKKQEYDLRISCVDKGNPPLETAKRFTVYINDLNDNGPTFEKSTIHAKVKEAQSPGVFVIQLLAKDPDQGSNGQVVYVMPKKYDHLFRVESDTGKVYTNQKFDRELNTSISFQAIALDKEDSNKNSTVTVIVTIEDVNDCVPVFDKNYTFYVKENEINAKAGQIKATDCDIDSNAKIRYYIKDIKQQYTWRIDKSGLLYVTQNKRLDREATPIYHLAVVAADFGQPPQSSTTFVTIIVKDENDHSPRFVFPNERNNQVNITEPLISGMIIAKIRAVDQDEKENSDLSYFIDSMPPSKTPFRLNNATGELMLDTNFNLKEINRHYRLIISAVDGGTPPRRNTAVLSVTFSSIREQERSPFYTGRYPRGPLSRTLVISFGIGLSILVLFCLILLLSYFFYYLRVRNSQSNVQSRQKGDCFPSHLPSLLSSNSRDKQLDCAPENPEGGVHHDVGILFIDKKDMEENDALYVKGDQLHKEGYYERNNFSRDEIEAMMYTKLSSNMLPSGEHRDLVVHDDNYWGYPPPSTLPMNVHKSMSSRYGHYTPHYTTYGRPRAVQTTADYESGHVSDSQMDNRPLCENDYAPVNILKQQKLGLHKSLTQISINNRPNLDSSNAASNAVDMSTNPRQSPALRKISKPPIPNMTSSFV